VRNGIAHASECLAMRNGIAHTAECMPSRHFAGEGELQGGLGSLGFLNMLVVSSFRDAQELCLRC
jgi:hypothetical protein